MKKEPLHRDRGKKMKERLVKRDHGAPFGFYFISRQFVSNRIVET